MEKVCIAAMLVFHGCRPQVLIKLSKAVCFAFVKSWFIFISALIVIRVTEKMLAVRDGFANDEKSLH
jgi:hypothetical protein